MWDELPAAFRREVEDDPDTLAVLVHGSRARGVAREDSDWDLVRVLSAEARERRAAVGGALHEKRPAQNLDVVYVTPDMLRRLGEKPDWPTAAYATAAVVFDRTGEIDALVRELVERAGEAAYAAVPEAYDGYLNCFVRSLKSWRRGDELGGRLHAAESALYLLRTLWGVERTWPPYHDMVEASLGVLETSQGWEPGSLRAALLVLLDRGDPVFQQQLELRVEQLLESRGFQHEWEGELDEMRAIRFPDR